MDLRTRTSLFCGALALAIAVSILLRGRPRRPQIFFAAFAADIGLWYLAQWMYQWVRADVWARFTAVLAVLLPQFAVHLFEAIVPTAQRRSTLARVAFALMVPMLVLVLSPQHEHGWVRGAVFLYVFGLLAAGLWTLALRGERSRSRETQRRVRFLVLVGAAAAAFTLADFLWFIGAPLPPVGAVLSIVFLFILAESFTRERLVDLYDILGQLLVSTALAFCLAGIFYVFVVLFGGFDTMYLGAILAAIVILVLFEPLHAKVEGYIHKVFFRERVDLERSVAKARAQLPHIVELGEMQTVVLSTLEESRRATAGALYLRDPAGSELVLGFSFGPAAPARIDEAAARPLLDRLSSGASIFLEELHQKVSERRRTTGWTREAEVEERLAAAAELLGPLRESLALAVHGESQDLLGILLLMDDRVKDAFSPDEVSLLESLAVQIGVVVENSHQYRRMQERDRLAALGQMAAGLAHEVKNPLGAIKGAAQLLAEPQHSQLDPAAGEFVGIILEEVDRLDRVVGSVLDYARPSKGNPGAVDVNTVVKGTLRVLASDRDRGCTLETELAAALPMVRADAEQLRQVLMNLIKNAIQAMNGTGQVTVSTRERRGRHPAWGGHPALPASEWVEIAVRDAGPGIGPSVLKNLFVPFFTTKHKGTGLGLAISQRMIEAMGGRIEVSSQPGAGSTFTVVLPVVADPALSPRAFPAASKPPQLDAESSLHSAEPEVKPA